MGKGYLIDTNVAIDYLGGEFKPNNNQYMRNIVDDHFSLSVINEIELLSYNASESELKVIRTFIKGAKIITINQEIVNTTSEIRRSNNIKLPDAVIAATVRLSKLTLLTRNIKDFKKVLTSDEIINPHDL